MVAHGGQLERGASLLGDGFHVGAVIEQQADLGDVGYRPHEGGGAEHIGGLGVGALIEEQLHCVERSGGGGVHQGSDAVIVLGVGIGGILEQCAQAVQIVGPDGSVEVVARAGGEGQHGGGEEGCDWFQHRGPLID